jgi:hypothetical protein
MPVFQKIIRLLLLMVFVCTVHFSYSQQPPVNTDTAQVKKESKKKKSAADSTSVNMYSPRKAAIRSAILPGWGQAYNKKYWKIPIVWGALITTGVIFTNNLSTYKDLKQAYIGKYNARVPPYDSTEYWKIPDYLLPLSEETIRYNRDEYRRYVDYSALFFIIFWGLNVVDAAVDAHLKSFDVSPTLSLQIKPGYSEMARTNGVSLVLHIGR